MKALTRLGRDFVQLGKDIRSMTPSTPPVDGRRPDPVRASAKAASTGTTVAKPRSVSPMQLKLVQDGWPIYVEHMNLPAGTRLKELKKTQSGITRVIELPPWQVPRIDMRDLRRSHAKFIDGGVSEDRVIVRRGANARLISIHTIYSSAFDKGKAPARPPVEKNRFPLGYMLEGDIQWFNTGGDRALHTIVAGQTGYGKSKTLEHMAGCLAEQGFEIWLGDPTGGSEFVKYERLASTTAYTALGCAALLQLAVQEIEARYEQMGKSEATFWPGQRLAVFVDEIPLVLDKSLVTGYNDKGKEIKQGLASVSAMKAIVMRGRRAGVSLFVGIQSARAEDMSGAARAQFTTTVCHRVQRAAEVPIILGPGAIEAGWDASKITAEGRAYLVDSTRGTEQIQLFMPRDQKDVAAHRYEKSEIRRITGDSGVITPPELGGESAGELTVTHGPTVTESPALRAGKAQERLTRVSQSKWALPILRALADSGSPILVTHLARTITDDEGNVGSGSRTSGVLDVLQRGGLVRQVSDRGPWEITPAGRQLVADEAVSDFYAVS